MTYAELVDAEGNCPNVQASPAESQRSGLSIGRLHCGTATDWSRFDPVGVIEESGFDLIIMRYPSGEARIAERIAEAFPSWIADTLIYFSLAVADTPEPDETLDLVTVDSDVEGLTRVIEASFRSYTNHYAANSRLAGLDIVQAYTDWTLRQAQDPQAGSFILKSADVPVVAFAALDMSHPEFNEWNISGVHPDHQGRGIQTQIMRHLGRLTRGQGKTELIGSTQASNLPSMRAFCKEGFLPVLSVNTLHVMPQYGADKGHEG